MENKKTKLLILAVALPVLLIVLVVGIGRYNDRQKFTVATKEIAQIAEQLKGNGSSEKKQEYCMRNDLKYSKGNLSCITELILTNNKKVNALEVDVAVNKVGWTSQGSNLESWKDADDKYILANTYTDNKVDCYVRAYEKQSVRYLITIGCSGPAKAEWFPVREN